MTGSKKALKCVFECDCMLTGFDRMLSFSAYEHGNQAAHRHTCTHDHAIARSKVCIKALYTPPPNLFAQ